MRAEAVAGEVMSGKLRVAQAGDISSPGAYVVGLSIVVGRTRGKQFCYGLRIGKNNLSMLQNFGAHITPTVLMYAGLASLRALCQ